MSETNAVIIGENVQLGLGCNAHNRFIDRLERRDGVWRILDRRSVYDFSAFTFPGGVVDIERAAYAAHPGEYAALAYLLDASGFPVRRTFATRGSGLERELKQAPSSGSRPGPRRERRHRHRHGRVQRFAPTGQRPGPAAWTSGALGHGRALRVAASAARLRCACHCVNQGLSGGPEGGANARMAVVSTSFPEPTRPIANRADVLVGYLDFFRARTVEKVAALPEAKQRVSRLASGWTPLELVRHLTFVERRWLVWGFLGQDIGDPFGDTREDRWWVGADEAAELVLSELREQG